tara:strand:+ start:55155 stop:55406 length:252 start_codon:yes stop_codon:yes gene_type:complete
MSRGTFECPNCGAAVKAGAKVCRECGSDDATGWMSSEEIDYQSTDIPDGYGPENELDHDGGKSWMKIVAIVLVVGLLLLFVLR